MSHPEQRIRELELSNAELRAALILAGKEIRKMSPFCKPARPVLPLLRRVLKGARQVAKSKLRAVAADAPRCPSLVRLHRYLAKNPGTWSNLTSHNSLK